MAAIEKARNKMLTTEKSLEKEASDRGIAREEPTVEKSKKNPKIAIFSKISNEKPSTAMDSFE